MFWLFKNFRRTNFSLSITSSKSSSFLTYIFVHIDWTCSRSRSHSRFLLLHSSFAWLFAGFTKRLCFKFVIFKSSLSWSNWPFLSFDLVSDIISFIFKILFGRSDRSPWRPSILWSSSLNNLVFEHIFDLLRLFFPIWIFHSNHPPVIVNPLHYDTLKS